MQRIVLNRRYCNGQPGPCPWEVVSSVLRDARGNELWNLQNKDFHDVRGEAGTTFRMPKKTRFKQPKQKADLVVRWREQVLNPAIESFKFDMTIPPGLPVCQ